jgi:hypothetical protein
VTITNLCAPQTDVEARSAELAHVPPLDGYPTDRALLYDRDGNVFVCIDRRDAELCVEFDDHTLILPGTVVQALARFLNAGTVQRALKLAQA